MKNRQKMTVQFRPTNGGNPYVVLTTTNFLEHNPGDWLSPKQVTDLIMRDVQVIVKSR